MLMPIKSGDIIGRGKNSKIGGRRMKNKLEKTKLTDKDRKTLSSNLKICTDSHGEGCDRQKAAEKNRLLN